ncbi:MAG: GtrA family protein [Anaerolineaceae bacterium]
MIITNPVERTRFFKFAFVGAVGAVVDFGVFNLLSAIIGLPAVLSSVFSFILAVISNFIWNRYWTYPDSRSKTLTRQVGQFILVSLVGLVIRTPLFAFLEKVLVPLADRYLPNVPFTPLTIGHNISLAIAIVVVMLWNFIANRYWTYGDVKQ